MGDVLFGVWHEFDDSRLAFGLQFQAWEQAVGEVESVGDTDQDELGVWQEGPFEYLVKVGRCLDGAFDLIDLVQDQHS